MSLTAIKVLVGLYGALCGAFPIIDKTAQAPCTNLYLTSVGDHRPRLEADFLNDGVNDVEKVAQGAGSGVVDFFQDFKHSVSHPAETVEGLKFLATSPRVTYNVERDIIRKNCQGQERYYCLGRGVATVGSLFVPVAGELVGMKPVFEATSLASHLSLAGETGIRGQEGRETQSGSPSSIGGINSPKGTEIQTNSTKAI